MKLTPLLAGALLLFSSAAIAESDILVANRFQDGFNQRQVTGGIVVGMRIGTPPGPFDIDSLQVTLPRKNRRSANILCLGIASQTGGYKALAEYLIADADSGIKKLEIRSPYKGRLKETQQASHMVLRAVLTPACTDDAQGVALPLILENSINQSELSVFVNAGAGRPRVEILDIAEKKMTVHSSCVPATEDTNRLYNYRCDISLPSDPAQIEKLAIYLRGDDQDVATPYFFGLHLGR